MSNSSELFRGKATGYARYRADYPENVIESALEAIRLRSDDIVADLGAGTGMLSRWFLERRNRVLAVEPDSGMRAVAEQTLRRFGNQHVSITGTAEQTTLADSSVAAVAVGNAFHYFDPAAARVEVQRILQPDGRVLIVAHDSAVEPNDFMHAYRDFVAEVAPAEIGVFHQADRMVRALQVFFAGRTFSERDMRDHAFRLTWEGLRGRFLSTSVAPREDDPRRNVVLAELARVFRLFEQDGTIVFQQRWRFIFSQF